MRPSSVVRAILAALGAAALAVLSYVSEPIAIALIVVGSLLVGSPALALKKNYVLQYQPRRCNFAADRSLRSSVSRWREWPHTLGCGRGCVCSARLVMLV